MGKKQIILIIGCYIVLIITSFLSPLVLRYIMDYGLMQKEIHVIIITVGILIVIAMIEEGVSIFLAKVYVDIKSIVVLELYTKTLRKLMHLKLSYFQKNNTAEIINQISVDVRNISLLVDGGMINLFSYILQVVSGIAGLLMISWKLATLVILLIPMKYLLIKVLSKRKEETMEQWINEITNFSAWYDDSINGVREIKLWGIYKLKVREMRKQQRKVLKLDRKSNMLETYNQSIDSLLHTIMVGAIYGIGGMMICKDSLSIGGLTAFITYSNYVITPIALIFNLKLIFAEIKPSLERLNNLLEMETEQTTGENHDIQGFEGEICFEKVCFAYGNKQVLHNVDFRIKKGEKVAIVGNNGSGKSTLIDLLLRFIIPDSGCIKIDDQDIGNYNLERYRNLFAVVSQDIYLYNDSVRNNITLGKSVTNEELENVCHQMKLDEVIMKLPEEYESILDKNGKNLSGGERQKLALVRAIIKDSPILILDEATASIDQNYNCFLQEIFVKEFSEKTMIIITHKKENLDGMDQIYKIEKTIMMRKK